MLNKKLEVWSTLLVRIDDSSTARMLFADLTVADDIFFDSQGRVFGKLIDLRLVLGERTREVGILSASLTLRVGTLCLQIHQL